MLRAAVEQKAVCGLPRSRRFIQTQAVIAEQAPPQVAASAPGEKVKIGINGARLPGCSRGPATAPTF